MSDKEKRTPEQPAEPAASAAAGQPPRGAYPPYGYGYPAPYGYGGYEGHAGEGPGEESGILGPITLPRLWRLLRQRKLTVIGCAVFGFAAAFYYVEKTTTDVYRASSVIEMSLRKPRILTQEGAYVDDGYASSEEAYNTRLAKFRSPAMMATVVQKLRDIRKNDPRTDAQLAGAIGGSIAIDVRPGTRLVNITVRSTDPVFAANVANAFAAAAEAAVFEENKLTAENSVAWLQTQAASQRKLLADVEAGLVKFRAENNLVRHEGEKKAIQQSLTTLGNTLGGLENQMVLKSQLYDFLAALKVKPDTAEVLPRDIPKGDEVAQVVAERRAAAAALEALGLRYTAEHPEMKAARMRVDKAQARLTEALNVALKSIATELDLLRKQAEGVGARIAEEQQKLSDIEKRIVSVSAQVTAMERERDACDIAYRGILNRIEGARLSADENTAIVKLVESAEVPSAPMPKRSLPVLLFGLLLGILGGFAIALAGDTLEDRVSRLADVEVGIGIKVLGLIPHVALAKRGDLALASLSHKYGPLTESFASIRALLNSDLYRDVSRSILITSSAPEEGKTVVSCNLAIGSAKRGLRTLLIDFDMRRPRLGTIFTPPDEKRSLLKVLSSGDTNRFADLPMATQCENLHVIFTRASDEANSAEVMAGESVEALLKWAHSHYDRVIVDSPPFGIVSDAAVLASLVESVIIICRPGKTRRRTTRHAVRHFTDLGANVIGAIVNDIDFDHRPDFSNSYYQHPYHYQQGYGEYYTKPLPERPRQDVLPERGGGAGGKRKNKQPS